jgi:hypothetical protein
MEKRTDRLTAVYVDLAVNVSITFGLDAGVRVLQMQHAPQSVIQRVLIDSGPRRGSTLAMPGTSSHSEPHLNT